MTDPIDRSGLAPRFWETKALDAMNEAEWEALCDGCGKCCLNKLEDVDTGEVALTRVACRLFESHTCRCKNYKKRRSYVPGCTVLSPKTLRENLYWMPETCAYKRLHLGEPLADWHPLLSGTPDSVHAAGVSMKDATVSELDVAEDDLEDHVIEEPGVF